MASYAETDSSEPSYSDGSSPTATYSITPDDSYVSIDPQTGTVTLSSTTPLGTYPYTVTATGTGNYQGTAEASISITINIATLSGLSYSNIVATYAESATSAPSYSGGSSPTATYTISPDDNNVLIDSQTGTVTLRSFTALGTYTYTVTATGTGNYQGTKDAVISINVTKAQIGNLSYTALTARRNKSASRGPTWTDRPNGQTATYSLSSAPSWLSIDSSSGKSRWPQLHRPSMPPRTPSMP